MFTTSTVIMQSRILPSWLAAIGYLGGVMLFVLPLITSPTGLVFPAWVLIVSIVLLATRRRSHEIERSTSDDVTTGDS
jgi:hypothetical protein